MKHLPMTNEDLGVHYMVSHSENPQDVYKYLPWGFNDTSVSKLLKYEKLDKVRLMVST